MPFFDRLQDDLGKRFPKAVDPRTGPQPPGRFSFGTQLQGGPARTDAFGRQKAPSLIGLIERYNALIYAMVNRTRDGVTRVPMRLMADGSRVQGKPSRSCDPIKVSRSVGRRLARDASNKVSSAAVDQIYEVRNHPLLDVLDEPDPYGTFTREKLIGLLVSFQDVVGDGFLVPEGNGWDWKYDRDNPGNGRKKGPPENLWVVYPQYTIPVRLGDSPIVDCYQYFGDRLPANAVLRFRHNMSLKDCYGASFSPTYAGEPYRQQEQELVSILSQVLGIGPRPNLIVSAKDAMVGMTPDQKRAYEQDLVRKHAGYGAGGVLVLDGSIDVTPVDYPKADIAAKEIAEHDRNNLANIFGMPPTYFTVDTNLANLQAADAQFARANTEPRCKTIAAQFTRLARMCDPRLFFAFDPPLGENEIEQAQVDKIYVDMGARTINQVNEETQYPAVPWGDEPLVNKNLVPITLLIEQAQQAMQQAQEQHDQTMDEGKQQLESGEQADELAADGHKHQKEVDKKKLAIDAKKASKPTTAKRSIDELAEGVLLRIEAELNQMTGAA